MPTQISSELYHVALTRVNELLPQVNDSTPADDPKMVELRHFSDIIEEYETRNHPIEGMTASDQSVTRDSFEKSAKFDEARKDGDVK